ncbi:hypothetical protein K3495_g13801 [Podosphaera aphanis]|nr:hypothetical protein K3495_g13801 [Podosphaera aphanis]
MIEYLQYMKTYGPGNEEIVIDPLFEPGSSNIEHVLVTHDEKYFYAFDGQTGSWLRDGESNLPKKVSDFMCLCHGTPKISQEESESTGLPRTARVIIKPSKNRDGWWKSEDMAHQLENKAIPLFEHLHPREKGVFCFDQSSNHDAYASNTLLASTHNMKPGGKQRKCHDTYYVRNGTQTVQNMQREDGVPKGRKCILEE